MAKIIGAENTLSQEEMDARQQAEEIAAQNQAEKIVIPQEKSDVVTGRGGFLPGVSDFASQQVQKQKIEQQQQEAQAVADQVVSSLPPEPEEVIEEQATQNAEQVVETAIAEKTAKKAANALAAEEVNETIEAESKVEEIDQKIDTQRWWKNSSTPQKSLAILGLILGSAGVAYGAQENTALNMLNKTIDDDIKAQGLDIRNALAKKELALKEAAQKATAMAKRSNNLSQQLKLQETALRIKKLSDEIRSNRVQYELGTGTELKKSGIDPAKLPNEELKQLYIPEFDQIAHNASPEEARTLRLETAENKSFQRSISEILDMSNAWNQALPFSEKKALITQQINEMVGTLRVPVLGPGVMTPEEREFLIDLIGNPSDFFSIKSVETSKLRNLARSIDQKLNAKAESLGVVTKGRVSEFRRFDDKIEAQIHAVAEKLGGDRKKAIRAMQKAGLLSVTE